jgi:formylglycine-generating enzyme required for sulfatase activity
MVGNVWELVEQAGSPSLAAIADFTEIMRRRGMKPPASGEPWCAIRGGSFNEKDLSPDLVWDSTAVPVRWKDFNIGFRCAKDAPQ